MPAGQDELLSIYLRHEGVIAAPRCVQASCPDHFQEYYRFEEIRHASAFFQEAIDVLRIQVHRGGGKRFSIWLNLADMYWYFDGFVSSGIGFFDDNLERIGRAKL